MGIFKGLVNLAKMKIKGHDINPDRLMIDKIVFLYKHITNYHKSLFDTDSEMYVFIMSYILNKDLKKKSIDTEFLFQVNDNINQDLLRVCENEPPFRKSQYKMYRVVSETMRIHYQIMNRKYYKNYIEKSEEKMNSLNEYINTKTVSEFFDPPLMDNPFKEEMVKNFIKELGS